MMEDVDRMSTTFFPQMRKVFKPRKNNNDVLCLNVVVVSEFYGIFKYTQAFEKLRFIFNGCDFEHNTGTDWNTTTII